MEKMQYSEENYKENTTNKNLRFIASRIDGFGGRMGALLNAMYCSKKFNIPFAFTWYSDDNFFKKQYIDKNKLLGVHAGKAEDIFSHEFIQKYYLPDEIVQQLGYLDRDFFGLMPFNELMKISFKNLLYYKSETPLGWRTPWVPFYKIFKDFDEKEYKKVIKECWHEIGFSEKFSEIMKKVDTVIQNKEKFVSIHIRSGDIVFNFLHKYLKKALVAELPVEIIVRELPHYNVVLIGDDITSLERIKEFSLQAVKEEHIDCHGHSVILAKNLIKDIYNDIQLAFHDCYLLSKGEKIFIPSHSAFSLISTYIAATDEIYSCYEYFSEEEQFEIIKKYVEKLNLHSAQKSFSYYHLLELSKKLGESLEEQLIYADKMLLYSNSCSIKVKYAFFLIQSNRTDLLYNYINMLSLDEIEELVKEALNQCRFFYKPLYKKFFIVIMTTDKVREAHLFSKIKKSFTNNERKNYNYFNKKYFFKFLFYTLLNIKLHN